MRKLLFNIHLYLALSAGVFVLILGLTGAIMAFEPELDHALHPGLLYVTPGPRRRECRRESVSGRARQRL